MALNVDIQFIKATGFFMKYQIDRDSTYIVDTSSKRVCKSHRVVNFMHRA